MMLHLQYVYWFLFWIHLCCVISILSSWAAVFYYLWLSVTYIYTQKHTRNTHTQMQICISGYKHTHTHIQVVGKCLRQRIRPCLSADLPDVDAVATGHVCAWVCVCMRTWVCVCRCVCSLAFGGRCPVQNICQQGRFTSRQAAVWMMLHCNLNSYKHSHICTHTHRSIQHCPYCFSMCS